MALSKPRKRRLIIIIIIIANRIGVDLNDTPPIEGTIYETLKCQLSQFDLAMWDSDENNWTPAEVDAWAAFEEVANQVEQDIDDETKLQTVSEGLGAALSAL